jgi:divalent metal cation (Fe/Co/Zn/Cd) transporter
VRAASRAGRDWHRIATMLVATTMAYNVVETVIALWAGFVARSVVLVGFGLDSVIECAAAGALLWRLRLDAAGSAPEALERAERRVHRFIGATFMALAVFVVAQAAWTLLGGPTPQESPVGIALAAASLVVMPLVAWGKLRAADEIGSGALRAEAKETLACSYLSFALLLGLGLNALWGLWWTDPLAALAMVPWLVREGREGLSGETCEDGCA